MLTHHDLEVVARDPGLPGLPILLDSQETLGLLQQLYPEQGLSELKVSYLKYKPGTNCLAGFSAKSTMSAKGPVRISAKAYPEKEYAKLRAKHGQQGQARPKKSPLHFVDAWRMVVWAFPRDRKVTGLLELGDGAARGQILRALVPDMPELEAARLETLCYKSERRYVGRLVVGGEAKALIKVYEAKDFSNAAKAAQTINIFTEGDSLRLARTLGIAPEKRIIASQWLSGQPLRQQLFASSAAAAARQDLKQDLSQDVSQLQAVGAALAAFHQQGPGKLSMVVAESEALSVLAAANASALLYPALAKRLRRLAARVAQELLVVPPQPCPIHGDFSADQVLIDERDGGDGEKSGRVAIIDYDQARLGDAASDFGSFLAQLLYDEARGAIQAGNAEAMGTALIQGYLGADGQRHGAQPASLLRTNLYAAAKLLQLAPQAFRERHPQWPQVMSALVHGAARYWLNHARHNRGR